jgi:hypothetical protein
MKLEPFFLQETVRCFSDIQQKHHLVCHCSDSSIRFRTNTASFEVVLDRSFDIDVWFYQGNNYKQSVRLESAVEYLNLAEQQSIHIRQRQVSTPSDVAFVLKELRNPVATVFDFMVADKTLFQKMLAFQDETQKKALALLEIQKTIQSLDTLWKAKKLHDFKVLYRRYEALAEKQGVPINALQQKRYEYVMAN